MTIEELCDLRAKWFAADTLDGRHVNAKRLSADEFELTHELSHATARAVKGSDGWWRLEGQGAQTTYPSKAAAMTAFDEACRKFECQPRDLDWHGSRIMQRQDAQCRRRRRRRK